MSHNHQKSWKRAIMGPSSTWRDRVKMRQNQAKHKTSSAQDSARRPSGISFDEYFDLFCTKLDRSATDVIDLQEFSNYYPSSTEFFFSRINTNGKTKIQKQEIRLLFVAPDGTNDFGRLVKMSNEIQSHMNKEFALCFDRLCDIVDQNNDNVISLEEFRYLHAGATQQFFAELDMNDDGVLSKTEFKEMFLLKDGLYDLPRIRDLTQSLIQRIQKDFKQEFSDFLKSLGFGDTHTELDFTSFKETNEKAFQMLFSLLEMESTDKMHVDDLRAQFFQDGKTPDVLVLRQIESSVTNLLKKTKPLDIAFGWNAFSIPFPIYEEKSTSSKKIYMGVRGEEVYVNDVGHDWIKVTSPMPGWIRVLQSDLKHVKQVKQYITEDVTIPAVSEGVFHSRLERTPTAKNLVCVTEEEDLFLFPHGEKFEIEKGWFQTLPYGLKVLDEDKKTVLYTMVSGEELHVTERRGQWVKLDSPMEGFLKVTNDENRVVIKQIRNFISSITEKLTKKAVEKHDKVKDSREARKKAKNKARISVAPPTWIEDVPSNASVAGSAGEDTFRGKTDSRSNRRPGMKTVRAADRTMDFFETVAEMAQNRSELRKLEKIAKMLRERQLELQETMLDEFDQLKSVAAEKQISMGDLTQNVRDLLHGHQNPTVAGARDVKYDPARYTLTGMDTLQSKLEMLKEQAALRLDCSNDPPEILDAKQASLRFLRDTSERVDNFRSETSTFHIEEGSLPGSFYS